MIGFVGAGSCRRMPLSLAVMLACVLAALSFQSHARAQIVAGDPWIAEPPPGAPTTAGYVTLTNHSSEDVHLDGVNASIAGRNEIHCIEQTDDGVMMMRPVDDGILIPAGGTVELKPGDCHLMFMRLLERPTMDTIHVVHLSFSDGTVLESGFVVRSIGYGAER